MTDINRKQGLLKASFGLWVNWAYPLVAFSVITLCAPYIKRGWVPVILFILSFAIMFIIRTNRKSERMQCQKLPYIGALTLMWTGCMFLSFCFLSFLHVKKSFNGQPYNPESPWSVIMILAPIGIVVCRYFLSPKKRAFCIDCEARNGRSSELGYIAKLFTKEAEFQIRCLYYIWVGLAVVSWFYFFIFYKNISLSNSDLYFFTYVPVSVFVLSLIYMGFRYHGFYIYYLTSDLREESELNEKTIIRYLVIAGNELLVKMPDLSATAGKIDVSPADTPVISTIRYTEFFNHIEAENIFREITGIRGADVRFLYKSGDNNTPSNIFHYAAYLNSTDIITDSKISGDWLDFTNIQMLHKSELLSRKLEAELYRIHTTVMAWKTYTSKGNRRYEIKHYQPTFRLCDMKKWDVDYNDPIWMFISMNNEDKHFFHLRKLWRKLITGTGI